MGVIQGFAPPWEGEQDVISVSAASLFLRAQASWLCRGLMRADDPAAVGIVLGAHDASHESWLSLIAGVQRCYSDAVAQQLAALYGFHGRVVGSLERGLDRRLEDGVAVHIREILADRLRELTESAISSLNADSDSSGQPEEALPG